MCISLSKGISNQILKGIVPEKNRDLKIPHLMEEKLKPRVKSSCLKSNKGIKAKAFPFQFWSHIHDPGPVRHRLASRKTLKDPWEERAGVRVWRCRKRSRF